MTAVLCLVASVLAPIGAPAQRAVPPTPRAPRGVVDSPVLWHGPERPHHHHHLPIDLVPDAAPIQESYAAPPRDYRTQVLEELRALGAAEWIVHSLDCIGFSESNWQNIRSHRMNSDGTFDHGGLQINDVNVRRFRLDPYDPWSQAWMALQLVYGRVQRGQRPFQDWATERFCR